MPFKIVHFAPFAPNGSGMYEAARDMVVADHKAGHDVLMVDVGATYTKDNRKDEPKAGQEDHRGNVKIITALPEESLDADLYICHTVVPHEWIVKTQTPIIFVMHGRPAACFNTELAEANTSSYTLTKDISAWPRTKAMLTFWPHHMKFWEHIIKPDKLVCLDAPPIDEIRFNPKGPVYDFADKIGDYNIVMADAQRSDSNMFSIMNGAITAAKAISGLKFHLFAMPEILPRCWSVLTDELKKLNALGAIWARRENMEEVYRAADLLLSPQKIVTRTIGESLSCGTPVITEYGCEYSTYQTVSNDPQKVAETLYQAVKDLKNKPSEVNNKVEEAARDFSLARYSNEMNKIYEQII